MEPRSRETTPTKEDLDFIVDDGYRHDEDPDFVSNNKQGELTSIDPESANFWSVNLLWSKNDLKEIKKV